MEERIDLYRVWAYSYTDNVGCLADRLTLEQANDFIRDFKKKNPAVSPVYPKKLYSVWGTRDPDDPTKIIVNHKDYSNIK